MKKTSYQFMKTLSDKGYQFIGHLEKLENRQKNDRYNVCKKNYVISYDDFDSLISVKYCIDCKIYWTIDINPDDIKYIIDSCIK